MRYWGLIKTSFVDGDGARTVLFVSGCGHNCDGCQNPEAQDERYGEPFTQNTTVEMFGFLDRPQIDGLTISGGDPMLPENRKAVMNVCQCFRERYGTTKTIWLYTGYSMSEIKKDPVLDLVDVVVDGKYVKERSSAPYRGSDNQMIWEKKDGEWKCRT